MNAICVTCTKPTPTWKYGTFKGRHVPVCPACEKDVKARLAEEFITRINGWFYFADRMKAEEMEKQRLAK